MVIWAIQPTVAFWWKPSSKGAGTCWPGAGGRWKLTRLDLSSPCGQHREGAGQEDVHGMVFTSRGLEQDMHPGCWCWSPQPQTQQT